MSIFQTQLNSFNASTSDLTTTTVQDFCTQNGLTGVSNAVKANKNGLLFVRFFNNANQFSDLYFTKKASAYYTAGEVITGSILKALQVIAVTNGAGEARLKLGLKGDTFTTQDIADIFS